MSFVNYLNIRQGIHSNQNTLILNDVLCFRPKLLYSRRSSLNINEVHKNVRQDTAARIIRSLANV